MPTYQGRGRQGGGRGGSSNNRNQNTGGRGSGRGYQGRNYNPNYKGRGGAHHHGGHYQTSHDSFLGKPALNVCRYCINGTCTKNNCPFAKVISLIATVNNSNKDTTQDNKNNGGYNNNNNNNNNDKYFATSDIALWMENQPQPQSSPSPQQIPNTADNANLKIFTASHDGNWRLYNTTNGQFTKEVEHNMSATGKVHTVLVKHNFLFCGCEAQCVKIPNVNVGMIFAWNLSCPGDKPMELHMMDATGTPPAANPTPSPGGIPSQPQPPSATGGESLAPYAHSKGVSSLITHDDVCFSGGLDHIIRIWKFDPTPTITNAKGGFKLLKELCGHVGEVTAMVFLHTNGMLWSGSTDGTIRLWDSSSNWTCKHLIAGDSSNNDSSGGVGGAARGGINVNAAGPLSPAINGANQNSSTNANAGHTDAITSLVHYQTDQGSFILSSSLDGNIKIWNTANGACTHTVPHSSGIVSMAICQDIKNKPILICGMDTGTLILRSMESMVYLCSLEIGRNAGHDGPVYKIVAGPPNTKFSNTFYTAGDDGNMMIWQISGDIAK
jgi:WD40 repeat protein